MITIIKTEDKTALPAFFAATDCANRNKQNRELYSPEQIKSSEEVYNRVVSCYNSRVFRNFRKNFITVKVDKPKMYDLVSTQVTELNLWAQANGFEIVRTANAIIYRLK